MTAPFGTRGAVQSTLTAVLFRTTASGGKTPSGSATQRKSHTKSPRRIQRTKALMITYGHIDITPALLKSSILKICLFSLCPRLEVLKSAVVSTKSNTMTNNITEKDLEEKQFFILFFSPPRPRSCQR